MNLVALLGRLTKDPQISTTKSGGKMATFSLAVPKRFSGDGGEQKPHFFDMICFDREKGPQNATTAEKYLVKGKPVIVYGELEQRSYEKDGQKVNKVGVVVDRIEFLPLGKKDENGGDSQEEKTDQPKSEPAPAPTSAPSTDEEDPWAEIN